MAYTTISKSTDYFNSKLYTGNATTDTAQTGIGFQPDWLWIKERGGTGAHILVDAVRGVSASSTPFIKTNSTAGNVTSNTNDFIKSLDSDGFTLGADSYFTDVNKNSSTYVAWNWKANGQGSSNTDGSINTTYTSANTTSGFSIVKWNGNGTNGATIGHGLGVAPKMVMVKSVSNSENWNVYHEDITSADNGNLYLNGSSSYANSGGNRWARSSISSSVFGLGSDGTTNGNGQTYIAYCFTPKTGFSKFGKYTGTNSTDGPFVYTGFKPAWVLIRSASSTNWAMYDSKRLGYNAGDAPLYADLNNAESTDYSRIDFLSNGFKAITTSAQVNNDNTTHIYAAFAEVPIVGSNNTPALAR